MVPVDKDGCHNKYTTVGRLAWNSNWCHPYGCAAGRPILFGHHTWDPLISSPVVSQERPHRNMCNCGNHTHQKSIKSNNKINIGKRDRQNRKMQSEHVIDWIWSRVQNPVITEGVQSPFSITHYRFPHIGRKTFPSIVFWPFCRLSLLVFHRYRVWCIYHDEGKL